jgi:hypothetical protein
MSQPTVIEENSLSRSQVIQWAVGSLILLRFLIPSMILPSGSESGSQQHENQKGAILVGRFLMKLCCKSHFTENETCLMNEAIDELCPVFDAFCEEVVSIGSNKSCCDGPLAEFLSFPHLESDYNSLKSELYGLFSSDLKLISRIIHKSSQRRAQSVDASVSEASGILLIQFKREIAASLCSGPMDGTESVRERLVASPSTTLSSIQPVTTNADPVPMGLPLF